MEEERVYHLAVELLARRGLSEAELTARLVARGAAVDAAERAVAHCRELGYLDDAELAAGIIRKRRHRGANAVRQELRQRGIDAELAAGALRESGIDPREAAREALLARFGAAPPADGREWRRRAGFLARQGFDEEVIASLLPQGDCFGTET